MGKWTVAGWTGLLGLGVSGMGGFQWVCLAGETHDMLAVLDGGLLVIFVVENFQYCSLWEFKRRMRNKQTGLSSCFFPRG